MSNLCSGPIFRRIAGLAMCAVGLILIAGSANGTDLRAGTWFKYGEEAAQSWVFADVPGDDMAVSIRPRFIAEPARQVMVVYPRPSSAYDIAITKILHVFAGKDIDAAFTVVNFNNEDRRGREVVERAERGNFDLIFSMGSESTAWLYKNYLGGKIPVVSVCSKDPVELGQMKDYDSGSGTNFAFTSLNMPIEVQMAHFLELRPQLRNFAILVDGKNVSAMQTQAAPMARHARTLGIRVLEVVIANPDNARAELVTLVDAAVREMKKTDPTLANSAFWITGSTAVFREIATINAHAASAPVLSAVPEVVQAGDDSAVLAVGVSFESNAHLAAVYGANVIMKRASVGSLRVGVISPPDIAINFRRARAIGLAVPFRFFESASYVYDYSGRVVRQSGRTPTQ